VFFSFLLSILGYYRDLNYFLNHCRASQKGCDGPDKGSQPPNGKRNFNKCFFCGVVVPLPTITKFQLFQAYFFLAPNFSLSFFTFVLTAFLQMERGERSLQVLLAQHRDGIDQLKKECAELELWQKGEEGKLHDDIFLLRYCLSFESKQERLGMIIACLSWRSKNQALIQDVRAGKPWIGRG